MARPHEVGCAACGGRAASPFSSLAGKALRQFERERTVNTYQRGQVIFYEGEPPLAVHCIRSGRVKVSKRGGRGDDLVIRFLGPGEIFGTVLRSPASPTPPAPGRSMKRSSAPCRAVPCSSW